MFKIWGILKCSYYFFHNLMYVQWCTWKCTQLHFKIQVWGLQDGSKPMSREIFFYLVPDLAKKASLGTRMHSRCANWGFAQLVVAVKVLHDWQIMRSIYLGNFWPTYGRKACIRNPYYYSVETGRLNVTAFFQSVTHGPLGSCAVPWAS
jgi:hypothetical protein